MLEVSRSFEKNPQSCAKNNLRVSLRDLRGTLRNKKNNDMNENELSNIIIGCAIEVHRKLGPGLLESAYKECLFYELVKRGILVEKEKPMPIIYKEVKLDHGYRIDLLIEDKVVVEN